MAHRGSFWTWDKDAVAAVNATGLELVVGKSFQTLNGFAYLTRESVGMPPLFSDQQGAGPIFLGKFVGATKFEIDNDGNIPIVGTVDGVDISGFKIVSIPPSAFVPMEDTYDWIITSVSVINRTVLDPQYFMAPVILPHGATITKLTAYFYRDDELAAAQITLRRTARMGTSDIMALVDATWTSGYSSGYDDTIDYPIIDNENYSYTVRIILNPNDNVEDVKFNGAKIELA